VNGVGREKAAVEVRMEERRDSGECERRERREGNVGVRK
jgi:hypothetical protein